jgi:hypothetical protein
VTAEFLDRAQREKIPQTLSVLAAHDAHGRHLLPLAGA